MDTQEEFMIAWKKEIEYEIQTWKLWQALLVVLISFIIIVGCALTILILSRI
jgi:hypothetical protein